MRSLAQRVAQYFSHPSTSFFASTEGGGSSSPKRERNAFSSGDNRIRISLMPSSSLALARTKFSSAQLVLLLATETSFFSTCFCRLLLVSCVASFTSGPGQGPIFLDGCFSLAFALASISRIP